MPKAQRRAHLHREKPVNGFMDSCRVSPFEYHKPIVCGNEGIDCIQAFQRIATFSKMGVKAFLQLYILEGHDAPLRDSLASPAGLEYGFRSCDDKPLRCLFAVTSVTVSLYSAICLP
jgi:hypothetical protein